MYVAIKLMSFIEDERDIIFKEILHDFINLSQTEKGLNVIKKFIVELKSIHAQYLVIAQIMQNPIQYIEHYYSNYAYQLIIKHWSRECIRPLFECVVGCVCYLSNQKCSSNVIETLMTNAPVELLPIYIKEITDSILSLLSNCYGSFVLQKLLSIAVSYRKEIAKIIKSNIKYIQNAKLRVKWEALLSDSMYA